MVFSSKQLCISVIEGLELVMQDDSDNKKDIIFPFLDEEGLTVPILC